jgi:hypothetical protein
MRGRVQGTAAKWLGSVLCHLVDTCNSQPLPLLEPLVEPVPSLEMGRVASGRASGIKFLPQHSSFEYPVPVDNLG